ncbi:hypothetical protein GCM10029976_090570 [Kribbella albertanoniae]|uniref:Uncharacterized protein n=1 Tax=Kribbella albertanoniae TaxID=1266829 RepID=A0A4R4PKJ6_9ACTN|nr:hypothetical protein [Kribbella albertanoniae]TDC22504.1 hypothetical protein E1261_30810 [Kribbella albertanoniae]
MSVAVSTHVYTRFANPYLRCGLCHKGVGGYHDEQICGTPHEPCPADWYLSPCGHKALAVSKCRTWSPVDGCTCRRRCS